MNSAAGIFLAARRKPRLPYDAEVEYLESTGTQWIDTGVIPSAHTGIETDVALTYVPNDKGAISGMCSSGLFAAGGSYSQYIFRSNDTASTAYMWAFGSTGSFVISIPYGTRTVFGHNFLEDCVVRVDGVQKATLPSNPTLFQYPIALMKLNVANNTSDIRFYVMGRLYHVRISDGSVISHDFIPVRFTNELGQSESAMYDRANPTVGMNPDGSARTDGLYRNRGTGAFVIGPDKTA